MHMLYNSDSFSVLEIEWPDSPVPAGQTSDPAAVTTQGGYEIVDKMSGKGIFLNGDLARSFRQQALALSQGDADEEAVDDFIAGYAVLAQQPVVLH